MPVRAESAATKGRALAHGGIAEVATEAVFAAGDRLLSTGYTGRALTQAELEALTANEVTMSEVMSYQLAGTVLRSINLDALLPECSHQGRLGLDVRVVHGKLSIGQQLILRGPTSEEKISIIGIDTLVDPDNPRVVRIHCTKPTAFAAPEGNLQGWTIVGE